MPQRQQVSSSTTDDEPPSSKPSPSLSCEITPSDPWLPPLLSSCISSIRFEGVQSRVDLFCHFSGCRWIPHRRSWPDRPIAFAHVIIPHVWHRRCPGGFLSRPFLLIFCLKVGTPQTMHHILFRLRMYGSLGNPQASDSFWWRDQGNFDLYCNSS